MWILLLIVTTTEATPARLMHLHHALACPTRTPLLLPSSPPSFVAPYSLAAIHVLSSHPPPAIRQRPFASSSSLFPTTRQVPKAFKVIPNLQNWEEILYLTEPENWSPHAVYQVRAPPAAPTKRAPSSPAPGRIPGTGLAGCAACMLLKDASPGAGLLCCRNTPLCS